mgnify:CR=1 FL=1
MDWDAGLVGSVLALWFRFSGLLGSLAGSGRDGVTDLTDLTDLVEGGGDAGFGAGSGRGFPFLATSFLGLARSRLLESVNEAY